MTNPNLWKNNPVMFQENHQPDSIPWPVQIPGGFPKTWLCTIAGLLAFHGESHWNNPRSIYFMDPLIPLKWYLDVYWIIPGWFILGSPHGPGNLWEILIVFLAWRCQWGQWGKNPNPQGSQVIFSQPRSRIWLCLGYMRYASVRHFTSFEKGFLNDLVPAGFGQFRHAWFSPIKSCAIMYSMGCSIQFVLQMFFSIYLGIQAFMVKLVLSKPLRSGAIST